jgi:plasmid stabilization system protein ParE
MSATSIRVSLRANADLWEHFSYLDQRSPEAAEAFLQRFDEAMERLRRFPLSGAAWRVRTNGVPRLYFCQIRRFPSHLIIYRVRGRSVVVEAIVHAAQDGDVR